MRSLPTQMSLVRCSPLALQPPGFDDALEEGARAFFLGRAENLLRRSFLIHRAFAKKANLRRYLARKPHVMSRESQSHAFLGKVAHDIQHLRNELRIERGGDFV